MSPITRSVSILMRARVGAGWARTIHGAAARTVAKLRRESDVAVFMGLHQNRSMSYGTGVRKGVAVGRRERTMRSKATAGLSLLSKLAQHFRRVQAPAFRRRQSSPQPLEHLRQRSLVEDLEGRQSSPQPLEHLRQRSLVEDLEALDIEAVKLPFTRFGARPSSSATDAYRRAEDVLRKVAHDRFRGHAAVNWVAGLDVNVDRFIAPADLNHLGHPEYPARRSGQ